MNIEDYTQLGINGRILAEEKAERESGKADPLAEEIGEIWAKLLVVAKAVQRLENRDSGDGGVTKLVEAVRGYTDPVFNDLHDRIDALEKRQRQAESRRLCFVGEFRDDGTVYEKGSLVSSGGSLWHADEDTSTRPAKGPFWTVVVRRGRDGRDTHA